MECYNQSTFCASSDNFTVSTFNQTDFKLETAEED